MKLLIHADAGARSGFVAAWLTDTLTKLSFDSGKELRPPFEKIHVLRDASKIKNFQGTTIRIAPNIENIDLLNLLFLRKNIPDLYPSFTKDEYNLETYSKLASFTKDLFENDSKLDYSLYTHVINFKDTFDTDFMVKFYEKVNCKSPTESMVEILIKTNQINCLHIDKNHACSILKLCLTQEKKLGLKEEHRFWSIVDIYNTTPVEKLYDVVFNSISPENYGTLLTTK